MEKKPNKSSKPKGTNMGLGIAFGVVMGLLFDNLAIGIALGIVFGTSSAIIFEKADKTESKNEDAAERNNDDNDFI